MSNLPLDGLTVCLVGIYYPPEVTGIAPYNAAFAEALLGAGAAVHVITGVPHFPMWRTQAPYDRGMRHDHHEGRLRISRRRHWVPSKATLGGRAVLEATFLAHALPTVMRSRADVIVAVTPSLSGLGAAHVGRRRRKVGVILQDVTGSGALQTGTAGSRSAQAISVVENNLFRHADRIGVIAPNFVAQLTALGIAEERICLLPNFTHVTPVEVDREEARARLGWRRDTFTVVHTGNMGKKQGLDVALGAARLAEARGMDIAWMFVGDGNQRAPLQAVAHDLDLDSVRFVDPLSDDLYPYALAAADVLLLSEAPGVKEFCLPSKLTSYVVASRPIVAATPVGSATYDIVDAHTIAHLVEPGDAAALLDGVVRISRDEELVGRLVSSARIYGGHTNGRDAAARYVKFAQALAVESGGQGCR